MRLAKHALHHHRVLSIVDQECRKTVPQVVETEPRTIFRDHPGSYRCTSNVVLDDHAAEPGLFAMQLEGRKQKIRVLVVRSFLTPALQQGRESFVHLDCRLGSS